MLPLSCSYTPHIPLQAYRSWNGSSDYTQTMMSAHLKVFLRGADSDVFGQHIASLGSRVALQWSFLGGTRIAVRSETQRVASSRKSFRPSAIWLQSSQIASSAFTLGTVAVLPFYTLMVLAPNAGLTRKSIESTIPYVILGILYAYLLYLSWTPDTIQLMFASKYWLPELSGIAKMFSSEMTLASAWVHLLVVDLFAARQIFHDGLKNKIETRHSVSFCLLFCPIWILAHSITKSLTMQKNRK